MPYQCQSCFYLLAEIEHKRLFQVLNQHHLRHTGDVVKWRHRHAKKTVGMCRDSETHNIGSATHDDGVAKVCDNKAPGEDNESIQDLLSQETLK